MIALEVIAARGPALVQDAGRPGRMHEGIPAGGPLVPERLLASNRAARNPDGAAVLEVYGELELRVHGGPLRIGLDGVAATIDEGECFTVPSPFPARVHYLAVRGGLATPVVLGGRGSLLAAGIGSPLSRGDRLLVGDEPLAPERRPLAPPDLARPVRVIAGPELPEALPALLAGRFRVALASDRTGMRLDGAALPVRVGDGGLSMPMVRGAIELPADGRPIVLGPDHPTTGGYPVVAVVIRADWGVIGGRRPGQEVRFVEVSLAEAREAWARFVGG